VGISSPAGVLAISSGTTDTRLWIQNTTSGTASGDGLGLLMINSDAYMFNYEGPVIFGASGFEGMRLNSTGLGIGTSSPASKLDVNGAITALGGNSPTGGFNLRNVAGTVTPRMTNDAADGTVIRPGASGGSVKFNNFANSAELAQITDVGNLLVGDTAARGTTVGTKHLDLFNGTAPAGTLTNGVSLYSSSGDLKFMNAAGDAFDVGYRNIPQNVQTGSYTLTLADAGDHIYRGSGGAATWTIPAASSVAYPLGTAITFINLSATAVSIAITTDTMYLSSAGTTGTRTLAQYGSATAIKVSGVSSSGIWVISGSGLT